MNRTTKFFAAAAVALALGRAVPALAEKHAQPQGLRPPDPGS